MFPVICQIGPISIYSYGLMLAVAVIICSSLLRSDAARKGWKTDWVLDFVFWVVLAGILGARIFYVVVHWELFSQNILEIVMIQKGGLSWQGGLILGGITGFWYIRKKKLPMLNLLDVCAPYLALGQSIGRIGCFLNGCCYGHPYAHGIYFPVHGDRLHPTQLYDAVGLFIIFFLLRHYQKKTNVPGVVFVRYLILASLLRFANEFFRADHDVLWHGLSIYQWVCAGVLITALLLHYIFRKINKGIYPWPHSRF